MRNIATSKRPRRARSSSCSSPFTISDDDSPKPKSMKVRKNQEESHSHKKHHKKIHKHHRPRSDESSGSEEVKPKYKYMDKERKYKEDMIPVHRIKEEPVSEDERDRMYRNRHKDKEHSRVNDDYSRRHQSRHRREHSESWSSNSRNKRPVKEEIRCSDTEPEWGKKEIKKEKKEEASKNNAKPDFGLSGKLTEDANTVNGVVIKYSEPPEARKPKRRWRLYPFKGETSLPVLHIHRQSAYLMGRDRKVADIPIDHPSCSKQHAALQYRLVPFTRNDGSSGRQIKLYVIDLESANGTYLNNQKIEPKKYYELKERDVVKFGFSSREYVILHEHSKDSENDDDVNNDV